MCSSNAGVCTQCTHSLTCSQLAPGALREPVMHHSDQPALPNILEVSSQSSLVWEGRQPAATNNSTTAQTRHALTSRLNKESNPDTTPPPKPSHTLKAAALAVFQRPHLVGQNAHALGVGMPQQGVLFSNTLPGLCLQHTYGRKPRTAGSSAS